MLCGLYSLNAYLYQIKTAAVLLAPNLDFVTTETCQMIVCTITPDETAMSPKFSMAKES